MVYYVSIYYYLKRRSESTSHVVLPPVDLPIAKTKRALRLGSFPRGPVSRWWMKERFQLEPLPRLARRRRSRSRHPLLPVSLADAVAPPSRSRALTLPVPLAPPSPSPSCSPTPLLRSSPSPEAMRTRGRRAALPSPSLFRLPTPPLGHPPHRKQGGTEGAASCCWKYTLEAIIEMIIFSCIHD